MRQFHRGNFIGFEKPINNGQALNSCNVAAACERGTRAEITAQIRAPHRLEIDACSASCGQDHAGVAQ
jgi:hypothetical protein